ncbi:hypothetical protein [Clostridium sp. JNZ J1-5]
MGYTILDLIDKFIEIEEKGFNIYNTILNMEHKDNRVKSIAMVLAKEEERHIKYYKALKNQLKGNEEEIDFIAYDKASFLVNKYKESINVESFKESKEILLSALDLENQNLALLIDIQGRIVKSREDSQGVTYKILSRIIKEEHKHIDNLKPFIKYK